MLTDGLRKDISLFLLDLASSCDELSAAGSYPEDEVKGRFEALANLARGEAERVEKPFRLGVVGMFKSGKSSVLNTFLRRKVLQEGRIEATAVLTELRFAASPDQEKGLVEFHAQDPEEYSVEAALAYTDVRSEIFQRLSEEEKRRKQESVKQVTLHLHCDLLRTLILLDTPGFGGSAVGDRKAFEALTGVDAALMVFSADRVGAQDELEIADALTRAKREIVALLNKVDDGHGGVLTEAQLQAPEQFLKENFRTLVRNSEGQPIIFRYSALEVWKALEVLSKSHLDHEEGKQAIEALVRWGFRGNGEGEEERGVIDFLRSRYFSNDQEASQRKIKQTQEYVGVALDQLIQELSGTLNVLEQELKANDAERSEIETRQEQHLEAKIAEIEEEIGQTIDNHLGPFGRRLEEALASLLQKRAEFDLASLAKALRSDEELANQVKEEFHQEFPPWEIETFIEDVQRSLQRLLRRNWKLLAQDLREVNPSVRLPEAHEMLADINSAVRKFAIAIGAYIAADIALLFIPGAQIIAVFQLAALAFGFHQTQKHKAALRDARRKMEVQTRHYTEQIRRQLLQQGCEVNDLLAEEARAVLRGQSTHLDEAAIAGRQQRDHLVQALRTLKPFQETLAIQVARKATDADVR